MRSAPAAARRTLWVLAATAIGALLGGCAGEQASPPATMVPLSSAQVCERVSTSVVAQALGPDWQRVDAGDGRCRYQQVARRVATLTVTSTPLTADAWRRQATTAGASVSERDGLLVADHGGDGFGPLDEVYWTDRGSALVARVDGPVSFEQIAAFVAFVRQSGPGGTAPGSAPPVGGPTGSTPATGPGSTGTVLPPGAGG